MRIQPILRRQGRNILVVCLQSRCNVALCKRTKPDRQSSRSCAKDNIVLSIFRTGPWSPRAKRSSCWIVGDFSPSFTYRCVTIARTYTVRRSGITLPIGSRLRKYVIGVSQLPSRLPFLLLAAHNVARQKRLLTTRKANLVILRLEITILSIIEYASHECHQPWANLIGIGSIGW